MARRRPPVPTAAVAAILAEDRAWHRAHSKRRWAALDDPAEYLGLRVEIMSHDDEVCPDRPSPEARIS